MIHLMKSLPLILALTALGAFGTSCGTDHAKIRVVHDSSDANSLDVAVDGKTVVTNLAFGSVAPGSDYLTTAAGTRRVEVRSNGTTTDLINSTVGFASQKEYTVIVVGSVNPPPGGTIAIALKTDDNSPPQSGNIKLRVIHGTSSGPGRIDIYVVAPGTDITNATPAISNLAYQQASDYLSVSAATYEVIVTDSTDAAKMKLIDQTYTLTAGQIRTLVTLSLQQGSTPLVLNDLN